jgi:hypothetical protein
LVMIAQLLGLFLTLPFSRRVIVIEVHL